VIRPPTRGRSQLATPCGTFIIADGRKRSNVNIYIDSDGDIDSETVTVLYDSDGATVKTISTKCSHHVESRKNRQPIMHDPFSGIHVLNEVLLDEEGTCCSSKYDDQMNEAMDDGVHGVYDLSWSRKEAEPDGWYVEDVDDPDPSLDAQTLL
jgi:hypothetical protein